MAAHPAAAAGGRLYVRLAQAAALALDLHPRAVVSGSSARALRNGRTAFSYRRRYSRRRRAAVVGRRPTRIAVCASAGGVDCARRRWAWGCGSL